jgi:4-hydroxythreonine-4-phosphate dehydrogenase
VRVFGQLPHHLHKSLEGLARLELENVGDSRFEPGRPSALSGQSAIESLRAAALYCLHRKAQALVTGPVDKYFCALNDQSFVGQTEFLKKLTQSNSVTMMLANSQLRVALVTTHLALRDVSRAVTSQGILQTTRNLHLYLRRSISNPQIAVCALNPHASDHGLFGDEEERILKPAIDVLKEEGLSVSGPLPADTAFCPPRKFDAYVCMYHDQALIPLKMSGFFEAINVSLGLPFLRTSVDHGTAFDIAGRGQASPLSLKNALEAAREWAKSAGH